MTEASSAVVVGGAAGIGAAVAQSERDRGAQVIVWDVAQPADVCCDVTVESQIEAAVAETIDRIGVPHRVTVTAGVGHAAPLDAITADEWDRVLAVNTRGPMLVMRAFARAMTEAGMPGSMVATSSISARLADPTMGAYCASKAALSMVVRVAALEWGPAGIRVNAIAPGATNTAMLGGAPLDSGWLSRVSRRTALGGIGEPDQIAAAVLALHDLGWVTGQVLECDGGLGQHSPVTS